MYVCVCVRHNLTPPSYTIIMSSILFHFKKSRGDRGRQGFMVTTPHPPFLRTARFACQAGVQPVSLVRSLILSLPNISAINTFYPVPPSFKLSQHLVPPSHHCLSHSHTLSSHPLCVSLSFPSHACRYTHPADLRTHTEIPPTPHFLHDTPGPSPARVHGWNPVSCEYFFEYILEYYILDLTQMSPPACPSPCAQIPQA